MNPDDSFDAMGNHLTTPSGNSTVSITDMNGHKTSFTVGTSTAGNAGDPDPNIGDRGQVLWVKDAGYNDSTSPSYHKQFTYTYNQYGQKLTETNLDGVKWLSSSVLLHI